MKTLDALKDELSYEQFNAPYDYLLMLGSQLKIMELVASTLQQQLSEKDKEIAELREQLKKLKPISKSSPNYYCADCRKRKRVKP